MDTIIIAVAIGALIGAFAGATLFVRHCKNTECTDED
jgi:hypothetical protein